MTASPMLCSVTRNNLALLAGPDLRETRDLTERDDETAGEQIRHQPDHMSESRRR